MRRLWRQLFATKSLETLLEEMEGENRLRRALGPLSLTSLGVGAIIGAGIFVMTGRAAATDAGPAIMVSYMIAALACTLAAFCYAEFASMAPVAGSAYTYSYATLGELFAWIIGWDLVLEYAMSCATVASAWAKYLNAFLDTTLQIRIPEAYINEPFTHYGCFFNLPAMVIMTLVTLILVVGIRESAWTNTFLVIVKVGVVLFVIGLGVGYVNSRNWTSISPLDRILPGEGSIRGMVEKYVGETEKLKDEAAKGRAEKLTEEVRRRLRLTTLPGEIEKMQAAGKITTDEAQTLQENTRQKYAATEDVAKYDEAATTILENLQSVIERDTIKKWGLLGVFGFHKRFASVDDSVRSNFAPYGFSGIMVGAAIVFFAFIGFDSISTHAEEAKSPARDVPIGILASLFICSIFYVLVSAVITGMESYPTIDQDAAISTAFSRQADLLQAKGESGGMLRLSSGLIALGGLAGMTSVLLVTFLSQSRIFLAMARDGLLPPAIFGEVHSKFQTPHISTILTGATVALVAGFTPIEALEEMVNIGTLFAFTMVCITVMILRVRRPDAKRPFRCPALFVLAPLGVFVNVCMMLFLPWETWMRLLVWLAIGLVVYFLYGVHHSRIRPTLANT